jgi:outer membrane protein OmpA-like peptidoglycan-associated protein/tetratricopeptide (TPR) repeat protein
VNYNKTTIMKKNYMIPRIAAILLASFMLGSCASLYTKAGKDAYENLQYNDAVYYLGKGVAKQDEADARRKLADSYMKVNDYNNALANYEIISTYTDNTDKDRVNHARALMAKERYLDAKAILEGIVSRDASNAYAKQLLASCKNINRMKADSVSYIIEPMNIPAAGPVYAPRLYNGGLLFTSPSGNGEVDPYTKMTYSNLYTSKREGASWGAPQELLGINGNFHDAVAVVSPSGNTIIFTRSFMLESGSIAGNENKVSTTQLYSSRKAADGTWEKPTVLPFCDNKYMFAHPAFASDGKTLYFASDMPGGFGGMDIWVAKMTDNVWGTPMNLGGNVNSAGNEIFPTLRRDDELYYSSDIIESLGGYDLMSSANRSGIWERPVHLSYPLNSSYDDFSIAWNPDNKTGYFSSDRYGSDRIFSFIEDDSKVTFNALVTGRDSKLPLGGAKIIMKNLTDGTEQMYITDGNGKFTAELMKGKDYQMVSELEGYFSQTDNFNTRGDEDPINKMIEMGELYVSDTNAEKKDNSSVKAKGIYDLPDIHWDYNKWDIRTDAYPYLDNLVKLFRENNNLKFELRSHTDCRGSYEYNDDLSSKRAKAVTDYMVKKGVPRSIIVSKGYGERELLNNCTDGVFCEETLHEENRRTEFIVTGKKK